MDNQDDDESIHSTGSNNPEYMVIFPCDNFPKYGVWLKQQFPHIISTTGGFFVHSQLRIRRQEDIDDYLEYTPEDWKEHFPRSYHIWRKTIIELIIIWTVTSNMNRDISYAKYMETRERMHPTPTSIMRLNLHNHHQVHHPTKRYHQLSFNGNPNA
jgi:hypothetical protein